MDATITLATSVDYLPLLTLPGIVPLPGPPLQARIPELVVQRLIEANGTPTEAGLVAVATATEPGGRPDPAVGPVVGATARVHQVARLPNGEAQVILQPLRRIRVLAIDGDGPLPTARIEVLTETVTGDTEERALAQNLSRQFRRWVSLAGLPDPLAAAAVDLEREPGPLADLVASALASTSVTERSAWLAETVVARRLRSVSEVLTRELLVLETGKKIQDQVQAEMGQNQREHYLREQLRAIQKELGGSQEGDIDALRQRLRAARLSPEAQVEADRELERLATMPPGAAESSVARTYLDWLAEVPWRKASPTRTDLARASKILDQDHEGLDKIKERILEYIAVRKLRGKATGERGQVLCFVGPPGVGKTSLGRSIARALGRRFSRLSLGGVRDEAEIRGHRRTYVGAMPGRLVQALRKAGTTNPVIMLDEVDKVGADHRGDVSAALLEVLDPEQNSAFVDHYLDVPIDLSGVVFIATANDLGAVPAPLRDRMEILQLPGYSEEEKVRIARRHLWPRQLRANGLGRRKIEVDDEALRTLIRGYTREAGLRNLERELAHVARKIARRVVEGQRGRFRVAAADLAGYLGPEKIIADWALMGGQDDMPGLVPGLAWTPAGGEVLYVEASQMQGEGLRLTGQLGDVMRESAQIALSYTRSHTESLGLAADAVDGREIHIHLPSGAVPKDGPSAGVTLATALVSLLTDTPVRQDVAMTGEITLRGRVLPVGGIEQKVMAARRAGISTVILPRRNERDLAELPAGVTAGMEFVLVDDLSEVFRASLVRRVAERKAA